MLTLIGSQSSESGGNSMAPAALVDASVRPTKVDRTSDVTGLVDTGKLVGLLDQDDAVRVMESIQRLSDRKLARVDTGITRDAIIKDMVRCNYVKAKVRVHRYRDGAMSIFHGPRKLAGYDTLGRLMKTELKRAA